MNFSAYSQVFISSKDYDSKKIYQERRQKMMEKLDSLCVIAGMDVEPGGDEAFTQTWNKMIQEPAFLYLTGINQPGCYLVLDPKAKQEILFVPPKDPVKEFWHGTFLGYVEGDNSVEEITGIKDVRLDDTLFDVILGHLKKYKSKGYLYAYFFRSLKEDHNDNFRRDLADCLGGRGFKIKSAAQIHWDLRLPLEDERITDARKAQNVTDNAFRKVLPQVKNFKNERELGLTLDYEMQMKSDGDLAFPTIVAGGENACCLHYVKKDEELKSGELVLLDFGIRMGTLHSDISRTIPVNGKFDPLQKLLYQIVLDAHVEYQKTVKPGVSLKEIGIKPWDFIVSELENRLVKNAKGSYKLLYDKKPHGISHFIGEQIHEGDPDSRSLDVILKPNMLISCEPGLYGTFSGEFEGKFYSQKIGIRIEDDLLITENGFINISKNIPKTVEEIEKLMA